MYILVHMKGQKNKLYSNFCFETRGSFLSRELLTKDIPCYLTTVCPTILARTSHLPASMMKHPVNFAQAQRQDFEGIGRLGF